MAGASRALSERAVRAADLGAARTVAVGAGRRASPDQIERAGGQIIRRAHAAEHFRRRRCHLRAQAAPARRTGRRFEMASPEIRRHLPLRGRGRRRQRRAGRHRTARRSKGCRSMGRRSTARRSTGCRSMGPACEALRPWASSSLPNVATVCPDRSIPPTHASFGPEAKPPTLTEVK